MTTRIFWILLLFGMLAPTSGLAQESQILGKLEILIQQHQAMVRRLEKLEIEDLEIEIKRLKENVQTLREIKLLVGEIKQSGAGSAMQEVRKLKEDVRGIYLKLSEIPMTARNPQWKKVESSWMSLQGRSPEFMGESEISFYQDQLKNLGQDLRNLELEGERQFKKLLDETYGLHLRLSQDPWANQGARWKLVSGSWEKSWERREEKGISGSAQFEGLAKALTEIDKEARELKEKAATRAQSIYDEVSALYQYLAKVPLATRQEKWIACEQKWTDVRDISLPSLSPLEIKKAEIDLVTLRLVLSSYQFELQQQLTRLFPQAQSFHDKLRNDAWAQLVPVYPKVIQEWEAKWQSKTDLSLSDAAALEFFINSFGHIQKTAEDKYKEIQGELAGLKLNIEKTFALLEPAAFIKRDARWFDTQSKWQELQYIPTERMSPASAEKHMERCREVYAILFNLHTYAQKQVTGLMQNTRQLYQKLSQDSWALSKVQWTELSQKWGAAWSWKTEVKFAEATELENLMHAFQSLESSATEHKEYWIKEASQRREELAKIFGVLQPLGNRDKSWPEVALAWNGLQKTPIATLTPTGMQEYFSKTKEMETLLAKSQQALRFYCVDLRSKTETLYDQCSKNPWSQLVENWEGISQKWVTQRPLGAEVPIVQGPMLETFYENFQSVLQQTQQIHEQRLHKLYKSKQELEQRLQFGQKLSLISTHPDWLDWKSRLAKWSEQEQRHISPEQVTEYERIAQELEKRFQGLIEDSEQSLQVLWNKTRKLYPRLQQNAWTSYLLKRSHVEQTWQKEWAEKTSVTLEESEALVELKERLERCAPFWWRPLPPQKPLPVGSFIYDMTEVNADGIPSVPQWSSDGSLLAFQTQSKEHRMLEILDLVTGQRRTAELYDPKQRWVGFPTWAPAPYRNLLGFSGKRQGFYDLYQVFYSRTQFPEPTPLTDTPEYEKSPHWHMLGDSLYLFFLRDENIYCQNRNKEMLSVLATTQHNWADIQDFAVYGDAKNLKLAVCAREKKGDKDTGVYYVKLAISGNDSKVEEIRKVSELSGQHFAPIWTNDGRWVLCYLEDQSQTVQLTRVYPETARERLVNANGALLLTPAAEIRYKWPELVSPPSHVLYCQQTKDSKYPSLWLTSIEEVEHQWHLTDAKLLPYFYETDHVSLSPDRNFLSWTYFKEGEGKKLVIAVVDFPPLGRH